MPNLIERLDALSEAATPSTLELWTSCSFRRIKTADGKPYLVASVAKDGVADLGSEANCAFLVELANAYRNGTLREALRDAERLPRIEALAKKAHWFFGHFWDMTDGSGCFVSRESMESFDKVFNELGVELGVMVTGDEELDAAIDQERGDRLGGMGVDDA